MRIISKVLPTALLMVATACSPAMALQTQVTLGQDVALVLNHDGNTASAEWLQQGRRTKLRLATRLATLLAPADEVFVVGQSASASAMVVRLPSRPASPQGYCGAGHEDYLLLLAIEAGELVLRDRLRLQSCLDNVALVSDEGDDPRDALIPLQWPYLVRFEVIAGADAGILKQTVRVDQGRLQVDVVVN